MSDRHAWDVIVVGAGIAGAGAAWALAGDRRVMILEREGAAGYHATGRSAAILVRGYGAPAVWAATRASVPFLADPPAGFTDAPLLKPRGILTIATDAEAGALSRTTRAQRDLFPDIILGAEDLALRHVPVLRGEHARAASYDPQGADIEAAALHAGFLAGARRQGATLALNQTLTAIERVGASWRVVTAEGVHEAPILVNAAGAWADAVARLAGVAPLGCAILRRTIALVDPPGGLDCAAWPMVIDAAETFYFKPDAGRLAISPADETPSEPCDAQAEELDVAIGIDRVMTATRLDIRRVAHRWAGLRTFAPGRVPVCGFDRAADGFFWLAGQGGYGIQTAPGMSLLASDLILDRGPGARRMPAIDPAAHAP